LTDPAAARGALGTARLMLLFTPELSGERDPLEALALALPHVDVVQVRVKSERADAVSPARALAEWTERVLELVARAPESPLVLVNDRVDVAATRAAHGAQIGHRSLPPELARDVLGPHATLGYSAHDEQELAQAAAHCSFALLSPVWPTSSKPGAAFLGVERAARLTVAARLPVLWLGGVDEQTIASLRDAPAEGRPAGVAVRSAIMRADDPQRAARALLAALP